jgi:tetratricopeptide (TPR) repeat protein
VHLEIFCLQDARPLQGSMNRLKQCFYFIRYGMGKLFFPILEPLFILRENLSTTVRRHFDQAIKHIENKNFAVAQLNLNMVLSLYPRHFLARMYRGRIYLRQKQYRLASEDLLQANRISSFRFTHYRLYREYLESIGEGTPFGEGRPPAHWMGRLKGLNQTPDSKGCDGMEGLDSQPLFEDSTDIEEEQLMVIQDPDLTQNDREKFEDMGPIASHEVENADWDHVLKKLTS